jgi:hypothetical protein
MAVSSGFNRSLRHQVRCDFAGPALPGPRQNASAVTVLGGYAYVAGGNDGSNDLSSAVLISRDGSVSAAPDLLAPRSGHFAVRLPGNNSVLIAGGSAGLPAEIFVPGQASRLPPALRRPAMSAVLPPASPAVSIWSPAAMALPTRKFMGTPP